MAKKNEETFEQVLTRLGRLPRTPKARREQMTEFEKCQQEFNKLTAPVNSDPLAQTTVGDLYSAALFELDLHEAGNQEPPLTKAQVNQLRKFTAKWAPAVAQEVR